MECSVFNSRVFFGTIAAGVLAAGIAVPAIAATPAYSPASHVKSAAGAAAMPVSGALPGGVSSPKGLIGGTQAGRALSGLGLAGVPAIAPQLAGLAGGASAPGAKNGLPTTSNPASGIQHPATSTVPAQTNAASTGTPSGVKTSVSGRDTSDVLKSLPVVGSLTGNLPPLAP